MIVSIEQLYTSKPSFIKLLTQDLPVAVAFRLERLAKRVQFELDALEATRTKLVEKYGVKESDESGERIRVTADNYKQFSDEMRIIMAVEVHLDFEPLRVSELGDTKLSALDISNLEMFITE